ncbi:unnamed protein product [Musa acuminata subsp. burmannicoides]
MLAVHFFAPCYRFMETGTEMERLMQMGETVPRPPPFRSLHASAIACSSSSSSTPHCYTPFLTLDWHNHVMAGA